MEVVVSSGLPATSEVEQLRARLIELEQLAARRTRELIALHEISLEISQQTDLTTLLQTIVEKAAGLLNASMGGLYLVHPDKGTLELVVAHHLPRQLVGTILNMGEGLSGRVAQTGQVLSVPDYQVWEGRAAVYAGLPFRRVVGVPLKIDDQVSGVINVTDDQKSGAFEEDEVRLVTLFAEQAAIAVEKARLFAEAQRDLTDRYHSAQVQASLYRISEAAHTVQDLADLYHTIHLSLEDLLPARNFVIALYDAAIDTIRFPYFVDEEYQQTTPPTRQRGNGLIEFVLRTGEPVLGAREELTALIERERIQPWDPPAHSWLGVPLKVQDRSIGVIVVQTHQPGERLTEEHQQILTFVSTQVVAALQRQQAEQMQASIYRISEAAQAVRSLGELYGAIHQIVSDLMPVRNMYIALYDAALDTITFPYYVDELAADVQGPSTRQSGNGLTEYVVRLGQPWLGTRAMILDMAQREELQVYGDLPVDYLGAPLRVQDKVIGVIAVQSYSEHMRLTEEHRDLLDFVSTQVAMAIQRKRAEEALRESEQRYHDLFEAAQRQARELALLDRVRTTVTRELNLSELFRTVVTAIAETFGYTLVSLYILDGETLHLQHQVGYELILPQIPLTSGVTGRVVRTGQPELVKDVFSDPAFLAMMDDIISEVCVPLSDAGRPVGVLNIESTRGFRLTEADLQLMIALSEHISSAISRARLYTEARQNAARLRAAVESLPFDFWAMDQNRQYILQNSVSAQQWGERVGKWIDQLALPESVRAHWQSNDRRAFAGEVVQGEVTYEVDGEQRHFHEIVAPIWSEGEVQGIIGVNIDITDRQRAEAALRASEARLRLVTANIPVILFALDRHGYFTFAQGHGLEVIGLPAENLVGRSVSELATAAPRMMEVMQLALAGGALNVVFEANQRALEVWLSPLTSSTGEPNGVIGVAVDMTERERTAQALRDSEERYRILFDSNPHPMWAYDLETLAFLAVNDAALHHYGYSREEFLKMTIADIRPAADVPALLENVAQVTGGLDTAGVWRHCKKDGTVIEVEITSHTLVLDGRPAEIVLATDVTERRRTEEMLRRAQKMEGLGILAGGIAHDFNNLLVAILGQTSLALSQLSADSPARIPVEKAAAASRRAADLTRQLLAYSGRGQFERRPVALNQLIQENLHLFEVAVPKNVRLSSDLTEPLPLIIGDAGQLQQVVMNTIINAAEAIGEKAGQVMVRTRLQRLTAEEAVSWQIGDEVLPAGEYVLLSVQDNGLGMDAKTLSRIFDPFFSTKFTGRGLGLAAVLGIVRGHRGGLKVTSELKVGTTFEIVLPGGAVEAVEPVIQEALQEVDMTQQLVLVIDDEEPVRDAVTDILELEGLTVLTAPDGRTGLELYRQRQAEISLILLDLSMPGLNGEETYRELRQLNADVRVLLSSGYSHAEVAARFVGQSEVGFIQKPYDAEQLVREVKRFLTRPATG